MWTSETLTVKKAPGDALEFFGTGPARQDGYIDVAATWMFVRTDGGMQGRWMFTEKILFDPAKQSESERIRVKAGQSIEVTVLITFS